MIEVTEEMLALLREYQMGAYGELDDDCDKRMIAGLIELHEQSKSTREALSDYELNEILNDIAKGDGTIYDFARAVEQALGVTK